MSEKTVSVFSRIENGKEIELGKVHHDPDTETDYELMEKLADLYVKIAREIRDKNQESFHLMETTLPESYRQDLPEGENIDGLEDI